jgi:deazaflavin-dependent oxidoreductase (nitroreductase family)
METNDTPEPTDGGAATRYVEPGWFTRNVFNRGVRWLTRMGVSVLGSRELRVRGRTSGEWRTVPVNLLTLDGRQYLVAPRGVTQWVRNLRAAGEGELRVGRRVEAFKPSELDDEAKPPILRSYLKRWKFEIGAFFDGVGPDATDAELAAIAGGYPVFAVEPISEARRTGSGASATG